MELRFRRTRCHAQHLGNLLVLGAFYIVKYEHSSCAWWQLADRLFEVKQIARRLLAFDARATRSAVVPRRARRNKRRSRVEALVRVA